MASGVRLRAVQKKRTEKETGFDVLRRVLQRLRWDEQGGYPGRENGKWCFVTTGLPQVTPEELDALFKLAGIEPDEIVSLGECETCAFAVNGCERGYTQPCLSCKRPQMSNYMRKYEGDNG